MILYRYSPAGVRTAVDLGDIYRGQTVFLLGGNPALLDLPLEQLTLPGILTVGMNNVPLVFPRLTMWVTADRPECFSPLTWARPELLKVACLSRREILVPGTGRPVMDFPTTLFYGTADGVKPDAFMDPGSDLAWWRSVFPIALQLVVKLGATRVVLVGCGFSQDHGTYAWPTNLTDEEARYSAETYMGDLERLRLLAPLLRSRGVEVVSATPGSLANEFLPVVSLESEVEAAQRALPPSVGPADLVHSSKLQPKPRAKAPQVQPDAWDLTDDEAGLLSTVLVLEERLALRVKVLDEEAERERQEARRAMAAWLRVVARGRGQDPNKLAVRVVSPRRVEVVPRGPSPSPLAATIPRLEAKP